MFKKRPRLAIEEAVRRYVQSILPSGVHAFNPISDNDKKEMIISTRSASLSFEFTFENEDVKELSDEEKEMIDLNIVIPALENLNTILYDQHILIEAKVKKLKSSYGQ